MEASPRAQLLESMPELLLRVHHDRAVPGDWLLERLSGHGASAPFHMTNWVNLLTAMSDGGANDPLQGSRLKIQFPFCLGIGCASHLSPVVDRISTTRF
jgi:hypothetical protein